MFSQHRMFKVTHLSFVRWQKSPQRPKTLKFLFLQPISSSVSSSQTFKHKWCGDVQREIKVYHQRLDNLDAACSLTKLTPSLSSRRPALALFYLRSAGCPSPRPPAMTLNERQTDCARSSFRSPSFFISLSQATSRFLPHRPVTVLGVTWGTDATRRKARRCTELRRLVRCEE